MTFPRCTGYAFLFLTFLCCAVQKGFAQNTDAKALVSVSLQIVGEGPVGTSNQNDTGYFAMATVTNQQDTTIVFWIMSCSWAENWVTTSDSVDYRGNVVCYSNYPIDIRLKPHQSIHFYGLLTRSGQKPFCRKVRLGFRYYTRASDLFPSRNQKTKPAPPDVYWSNEVEIRDNLFQFQID
jgi:hypothetical protein